MTNLKLAAVYVAKTKALISCAVTAQLICGFVFTFYAKAEIVIYCCVTADILQFYRYVSETVLYQQYSFVQITDFDWFPW